ncbi:restriction endonuclease subunit S [Paenibacillus sp. FSL M7-1046]|uniref:restriction endonuclease subunit S n=1 Tax=Paenibacillus sp. FSL M7-1046 TaxID=2975315 RepID=UPI0030F918D3
MNAQSLRNSILQLAFQGKLVEQRREEGTTEELYQQIQEEKVRLIKEGKIKKEKPLNKVTEDEIPFDIPESWKWVRFGEVIDVRDGTHDTPRYVNEGIPLVTSKNLINGKIDFDTAKLISIEDADKINKRSLVEDSDILFAMIGSIGNPVLVKKDREFSIKNMALFKAINITLFFMEYLLWYLQLEQGLMKKKASGGVQSFVSLSFLRNYIVPLPPLEEQKRIVAKIEALMPYVEKYGEAHSKLELFNKKFPEDIQKSILQYAIQGKLVEQRVEEGNAEELYQQIQEEKAKLIKEGKINKEKLLPAITEDEIPFEIPESWKWVRLQEIGELSRGKSKHRPRNDVKIFENGTFPMIQTGDVARADEFITQYTTMYNELGVAQSRVWQKGTVCLTIAANIGDVAILGFDACFPDSVVGFNAYHPIDTNMYFLYALMCYKDILDKMSRSTAQKNINIDILSKVAFPLPPLAEQKRIVGKIKEMMPYCKQVNK